MRKLLSRVAVLGADLGAIVLSGGAMAGRRG